MVDWAALTAPFDGTQVKQRPGAATWDHKPNCDGPRCRLTRDPGAHMQFSYVDARDIAQRLDDVLTPEGWTFEAEVVAGHEVVRGSLYIMAEKRTLIRQDHGYPNSDRDEEPIKAATSDALKRCAVLYGIGRHLYDDNQTGRASSPRPAAAPAGRA